MEKIIVDLNKKIEMMLPEKRCELNYNRDYELLIDTILFA